MAALHASPGDAPKIVIAPATIEECFHFMITARKLAEDFRGPVIILSDANLATGQQPFPRPQPIEACLRRRSINRAGTRQFRLSPGIGNRAFAARHSRAARRRIRLDRTGAR